ncbi:MAG: TetR family transcriptional regulator [Solirubrobacteraceae bacterium]|nr:TetR family transcriptional regulator [Solirubrobacteraceae bacterium]
MSTARSTYQAAARQMLRTTLLGSARQLLRERAWPDITMSDIATSAGVSRQTLYNEFGSRSGFVQAYLLYDADRILAVVEEAIEASGGDPATTLEVAFGAFLETISEDPLAASVLAGTDSDGLLTLVTTRGEPVLMIAGSRLGAAIQAMWPAAAADDVSMLSTELVRLALSHAMLPQGDPAVAAKRVAALLTPFAEQALAKRDS